MLLFNKTFCDKSRCHCLPKKISGGGLTIFLGNLHGGILKSVSRLCSYCGRGVSSICLFLSQFHGIGLKLEFETLFQLI